MKRSVPQSVLDELAAKASELAGRDPASAGPHWGAMHKLLLKAKVDPHAIAELVAARDVTGLQTLVRRMRGEEVPETAAATPASTTPPVDADTMRLALRAFRNRLKFARLDSQSKLGVGPMTGGKQHGIDAIAPPREYPIGVWEALADAGKLRRAGPGFYALVDDHENAGR